MTPSFGMPIWYELTTADPAASERFYGDVVGWKVAPFDGQGPYALLNADDGALVGGMLPLSGEVPGSPGWLAYFHVADVDAAVALVEQAGGTVHIPASDIPGVGRSAMVADPQGVAFHLMTPAPSEPGQSTSFSPTLPQRCAWNELTTTDQDAALPFYSSLCGWTSTSAMPMGEMGDYSFVDCGDVQIGAMMNRQSAEQPTGWCFYFHIPDVDAVVATITAHGGQVVMGPMDVPGGQRALVAIDPQGAAVGFVSGEAA